jgi:hypothetical protein
MKVFEQQKQHDRTWHTIGLENKRKRSLIVKRLHLMTVLPEIYFVFPQQGGGRETVLQQVYSRASVTAILHIFSKESIRTCCFF